MPQGPGIKSLAEAMWLKTYLALLAFYLLTQTGSSTITSNITAGVPCPRDVITFTCTQEPPESQLRWRVLRSGGSTVASVQFSFPRDQPPAEQMLSGSEVSGTASLISSSNTTVVSTLTITVTRQLDGNVVDCSGTTYGSLQGTMINIASLSSPPQNVMVTIVENGTNAVTVNIDWDPPVNNGGGAVDSYTVETSPETATVRVTSGTTATLELPYNERYVVSVTAENCVGSSTPAMSDPIEFVGCPLLSNPNVTFEPHTSSAVGSMISYQCRPGFIPEGRVMSVCGGDGRWDHDPDQYNCSEVNCGAPPLPVNSSVLSGSSNDYRNGSVVTFQCNEGLFPSNEITIVCTSEERWSPDPQGIECGEEPVNCSRPNSPRNGFLGEVTSTTLMFGCNEGYSPQGTLTAVCVATDTWSSDPAQLECTATSTPPINAVYCGSPPPPDNGMVTDISGTLEGSEVTFQCNTLRAVCTRDGKWSPDPRQQVCGFQSAYIDASRRDQVTTVAASIAVVCSVVFYIGGVVSTILIYLAITRCKETHKQVTITSSGRSEAPAVPVYEDIVPTLDRKQAGIELQENVAYGPIKK